MRKLIYVGPAILFVVFFSLSGCASLDSVSLQFSGSSRGGEDYSTSSIGNFRNNSTVELEAGSYRGNLDIDANKVTLKGAGARRTVITGDVRIEGNSCVLRNLRVRGDVYIYGNNTDLTAALVDGRVVSKGQNNSW